MRTSRGLSSVDSSPVLHPYRSRSYSTTPSRRFARREGAGSVRTSIAHGDATNPRGRRSRQGTKSTDPSSRT
jgi:hypothetical protein